MLNEFYKLSKQSLLPIVLIITAVVIFASPVIFATQRVEGPNITAICDEYKSVGDLQNLIKNCNEELSSLDPDSVYYSENRQSCEEKIRIYSTLEKDFIPYNELTEHYLSTGGCYDNVFSYTFFSFNILFFLFSALAALFSLYFVSYDFSNGTYKFVYTSGIGKGNLLNKKCCVYMLTLLALFTAGVLITIIFSALVCSDSEIDFLMVLRSNRVSVFGKAQYYLTTYLSLLWNIMTFAAVFFGIGVITKNIFKAILADFVFFGITAVSSGILNFSWLYPITSDPFYAAYVNPEVSNAGIIIGMLLRLSTAVIFLVCARIYFVRKAVCD